MIYTKRIKRILLPLVAVVTVGAGALFQTGAAFADAPTDVTAIYNVTTSTIDINGTVGDIDTDFPYAQIRVSGTTTWNAAAYGTPPQTPSGLNSFPLQVTGMSQAGNATLLTPGTSYDVKVSVASDSVEIDDVLFGASSSNGTTFSGQPTNVQANEVGTSRDATATWEAPSDLGSPALSGYKVTLYKFVNAEPTVLDSKTTSGLTATFCNELTAGTAYEIGVTGINDGTPSPNTFTSASFTTALDASGTSCPASQQGVGATSDGDTDGNPTADTKASDDGFSLGLANPFVVITAGIAAAAALLFFARLRLVKK